MKEEEFIFKVMTQEEAESIAFTWKYPEPLSFYDMTKDEEELREFLNPAIRGRNTFTVRKPELFEIFAFFNYDLIDNSTAEFSIGLNPKYIGRGYGRELLECIEWEFVTKKAVSKLTIAVATLNVMACKVFEKAGYQVVGHFSNYTNGGQYDFRKYEKILCPC